MIFSGTKMLRTPRYLCTSPSSSDGNNTAASRSPALRLHRSPARESLTCKTTQHSSTQSSALISVQGLCWLVGVGGVDVDGRTGAVAARIDDPGVAALAVAIKVDHNDADVIVEMPPHSPVDRPQVTVPDLSLPGCFLQGSLHQSVGYPLKKFVKTELVRLQTI